MFSAGAVDAQPLPSVAQTEARPSLLSQLNPQAYQAAIATIRQMNANNKRKLPPDAPLDFLPDDWTQYVIDHDGKVNERYYALSGLWELRGNLRAGNVWVANSRRYANPETYLIPKDKWEQLRTEVCKQMNVHENGVERLQEKKQELAILLKSADAFLAHKGEVRIENGKLVMPRLKEEELPESARRLQELITARLPRVEITDLLIEVGGWVDLPVSFKHAGGSQSTSPEQLVLLFASVLAQAETHYRSSFLRKTCLVYKMVYS